MEERLQTISGIGPQLAKKLASSLPAEHLSIAELRKLLKRSDIFTTLPLSSQADLQYRPLKKIPHESLIVLERTLDKLFKGIKWTLAGSYRRQGC